SAIESSSFEQQLSGTTYGIELDEAAIAGADDAERTRAIQYYARAISEGNIDKLLTTVSVQYVASDGLEIGSQTFDFICLPKVLADSEFDSTSSVPRVAYFAVNRTLYSELRQNLEATSIKGDDS